MGDTQIPYEDKKALSLFIRFLKDEQPDMLIIAGDFLDCWEISDFKRMKSPPQNQFHREIARGREVLERIRDAIPKAEITMIEGNHEFRLKKYLGTKAPELADVEIDGIKVNTIENYLQLAKLKIKYVQLPANMDKWSNCYVMVGDMAVGHFDRVAKHGGQTAKLLTDEYAKSIMQFHIHRFGAHARTYMDGVLVSWEIPALCSLRPNYMSNPNWQTGFAVIYLDTKTNRTFTYPIVFKEHSFVWKGKLYD